MPSDTGNTPVCTPSPYTVRSAFLLILGVAGCILGWHSTFRDAAADTAVQQEPVRSNILSVEPAHPVMPPETTESMPPAAREMPALTVPAEPSPSESASESGTSAPVQVPVAPMQETSPDEAPLWDLLHAGRPRELLGEITRLRRKYPAWSPPPDLVAMAQNGLVQQDISHALAARDHAQLVRIARLNPELFSCAHVDWAWSLAEAYLALDQRDALFDLLANLIGRCPARDRLATLQKATSWLEPAAWDRLADMESANERPPGVDAEFRRVRYDHSVGQLLAAKNAGDPEVFFQRFDHLAAEIGFYHDADIALLAGWSFLDARDTANASLWFGNAKDWRPANLDATRGLALCALAEQRYADARRIADDMPDGSEGKEGVLRDAVIGMAQGEYAQNNYAAALQLLADAGQITDLPRYAQLMAAWSLLHSGKESQALDLFQALYREQPDKESAQGLFNSMILARGTNELDSFPGDEFLAPLLLGYRADKAFAQKRFLAARSFAPDRFGTSGGAGTARVSWHVTLRDKSGSESLSQLEDTVHSLEAVWPISGRSELHLRLDHHHLDSGQFGQEAALYLARGLLTGALGIASDSPSFADLADAAADTVLVSGADGDVSGWEPHVTWYNESRFDLEADIGLSLSDGVIDPQPIGHLSLRGSSDLGSYKITGYARPVRESILSYTGWQLGQFLPTTSFNGAEWGGVRGTGAELSAYLSLGSGFGVNGKIGAEQVDGNNVKGNTHESLLAGLNHGLGIKGFDYIVAGFNSSYDHYQHNLSQFTPGHGGYFSPQTFWQFKANLDFLTLENRKAIVKGHIDAGRVFKREATTPIIPLDGFSDLGSFPGNRDWGWAYTVELNGAMQVGNHVQLGANFTRRESPQYNETAGMLFVRVLFESRNSVLSIDLPDRVMDDIR